MLLCSSVLALLPRYQKCMAYGENHDRMIGNSYSSIHAEEHALNKLPNAPPRKKKPRLDILVIRTTFHGHFGISRPCLRCTMLLAKEVPAKGYTLGNIYYSLAHNILVKTSITELIHQQQENPHITLYYREKKKNIQ